MTSMYRTFLPLFGIITLLRWSSSEPCIRPLGVEDGIIQLTASTELDNYHRADLGRLNTVHVSGDGYGSWVAGFQDQNQWIQANLGSLLKVTRVITQGRQDADQWVTSYEVLHSIGGSFDEILDASGQVAVFIANSDRNTKVTNVFHDPVYAQFIRIHPTNWHNYISLRFEVLGCSEPCVHPLGIEDRTIPPNQLTASSEYDDNHRVDRGRLNTVNDGYGIGAWSSLHNDHNQWIQVDLSCLLKVTGVTTQGRHDYSIGQWVTSYKVLYSFDDAHFEEVKNTNGQVAVFNGNSDRNTPVTNMFHDPVYAKIIRIHPTDWYNHISLRFEILGCSAETILYNHQCYKFVSNPTTWNDAKTICESFSSRLVTINTEEELAYLTSVASTFNPFPSPWTGMNDIAVEGHPVWLTYGQPTYNEFTDNDDPENSDCFHIDTNGDMGYRSCNDEFGYVCETPSIISESYSIFKTNKSPTVGETIRSLLAMNSGACSLECGRTKSCVSFSFNSFSNECILSSSTGQSSELEDAEDADFYVFTSTEEICRPFA